MIRTHTPQKSNVIDWRYYRRLILSYLPGSMGKKYRQKVTKKHEMMRIDQEFDQAIEACSGKIFIDLGANLGAVSRRLALHASHVYAFEPDPVTFGHLKDNLSDLDNVEVFDCAVGGADGKLPIYRDKDYSDAPMSKSQSSSIMADNSITRTNEPVAYVEVRDIVSVLKSIEGDIGLVKIDVEGSELDILPRIFELEDLERIDYVFCETHERLFPDRAHDYKELRRKAAAFQKPIFNLDWH